jgi:hypothetical protein
MIGIKDWKEIRKVVQDILAEPEWAPEIVRGEGKYKDYIAEVSFVQRNTTSVCGVTYGSDQCTQPLLRRMAKMIENKEVL